METVLKTLVLVSSLSLYTSGVLAAPQSTSQFVINNPSNFNVYYDLIINSNSGTQDYQAWPAGSASTVKFTIEQNGVTSISGKIYNGNKTAYCNLRFNSAYTGTIAVSISPDSTYSVSSSPAGIQGQCSTL